MAKITSKSEISKESVKKVVIFIHGSGAQNMDEDLTVITKDKNKNLFFVDISNTLIKKGFTTLRYNKRSYQGQIEIKKDPLFVKSKIFTNFAKNALKYFVDDAITSVRYVEENYPNADIYLLGHSQGTYIALQVAHQIKSVKGVALIGFYGSLIDTAVFEQTVYRPISYFYNIDKNADNQLEMKELNGSDFFSETLKPQFKVLDLDNNKRISLSEFKAGNYSNILLRKIIPNSYTMQELKYPEVSKILKESEFKVIFFQGLWDNQTPAYHTQAIEILNKFVWNKYNMKFFYFSGLGHALDKRNSYHDVLYNTIDKKALKTISEQFEQNF